MLRPSPRLLALALCAFTAVAFAAKVEEKRVVAETADTPQKFDQVIDEIHQEMNPGGRYEFIKADARAQVDNDLQAMSGMLKKSGSVAAMSQPEKVALFNAQEHLNGILTHNDGNRLVCEHRPPMGSNIAVTSCKTVAEIEKMRRDAQKTMTDQTTNGWKCTGSRPGTGCGGG